MPSDTGTLSTGERIVIVSGLPRSGTSLMMSMLESGGIPPLCDGTREPDEDNPRGYYELEAVKQTAVDPSWVELAAGKAVKVISKLLPELPSGRQYDLIFMRRALDEILASQRKMLVRRGEPTATSDEEMTQIFARHVAELEQFLRSAAQFRTLFVSYNRLLRDPRSQSRRVADFLGGRCAVDSMVARVDPPLYRNRAAAGAGDAI